MREAAEDRAVLERRENDDGVSSPSFSGRAWTGVKFILTASALFLAVVRLAPVASSATAHQQRQGPDAALLESSVETTGHRRLQSVDATNAGVPSYMQPMMKDLADRKKLFADTPPEEVKYWFEYTGPLQVS